LIFFVNVAKIGPDLCLFVKIFIKHVELVFMNYDDMWVQAAHQLPWSKKWDVVKKGDGYKTRWFSGGMLNASYACVDVHAQKDPHKRALCWSNEQGDEETLSYGELFSQVNYWAHVLREQGVCAGDIVIIYMPMIPQALVAMLAVARLGAIHSVVFSGFGQEALLDRINNARAPWVITAQYGVYRGKMVLLKENVDSVLKDSNTSVKKVFVFKRDKHKMSQHARDVIITHSESKGSNIFCEPVACESSHPLFILYTSGTTGKPKGIVHGTGGYLTYVYYTIEYAFGINKDSIYWCTADIGWITGHSYVIYGPLLHGATVVMYEGAPDYPTPDRWWSVMQHRKVSIFYTAPTAIRMFMRHDEGWVKKHDLSSVRVLGSVGEPINPEVWRWYFNVVGQGKCPVIDTWWQTETGGFMIAPSINMPVHTLKPGSATHPLPGIQADIVDLDGNSVPANQKGYLIIKNSWPGMAMEIYGDPEKFHDIYWSKFKDSFYSYDYAKKDKDGYFWLLGRADDVLSIAGHRVGSAELESAVITLQEVAEAAAIGILDEIKGERIVLFIILKFGFHGDDRLKQKILQAVRVRVGAFVTPKEIYFVDGLPKTRSGKIMRRVLRAIVEGHAVGDVTTLEDGASVQEIQDVYNKLKNIVTLG
jgi:acetyl-CoA synthetase